MSYDKDKENCSNKKNKIAIIKVGRNAKIRTKRRESISKLTQKKK